MAVDQTRRAAIITASFDFILAIVGNVIGTLAIDTVAMLISAPELVALDLQVEAAMPARNLPYLLPFPASTVVIVLYLLPVFRVRETIRPDDTAASRLLNAPFALALITVGAWTIGSLLFLVLGLLTGIPLPVEYMLQIGFVNLILSSIAFVIIYYVVEAFTSSYAIPRLFPNGGFAEAPNLARATTRTRLIILYLVASLLPMLMLARIVLLLNNNGINPFNTDLVLPIGVIISAVAACALLITLLKAKAIARPVSLMVRAAERIKQFDFDIHIPVRSTDELGLLSERMNEMAAGLGERERMRDLFGRVVDPSVRDRLLSGAIDLGGEELEVSVLFLDVAQFTSLSERMKPEQVVALLNVVFARCTTLITAAGGHVDKYIGDAVMAIFGAPTPVENHARAAIRAVRSIMAALPGIGEELRSKELPEVQLRAGLHTGVVLAGTIGSRERMEYTVIGDTVNIASRLVGAAKEHSVRALASSVTADAAGLAAELARVGSIQIRGRVEPVDVLVVA